MQRAIIFDFGGILIDWNPDYVYRPYFKDEAKMRQFYDDTGIHELNKELDRGLPFAEGLAPLAAQFPQYAEPIWYWKTRWLEMIGGPIPETVTVLEALYAKGHALYGLTNWAAETFALVYDQYAFFRCFKDIVVSGVEKTIKPEPEIFQILLKRNQLDSTHCLFVDDNLANVIAARTLGIQAFHTPGPAEVRQALKGLLT